MSNIRIDSKGVLNQSYVNKYDLDECEDEEDNTVISTLQTIEDQENNNSNDMEGLVLNFDESDIFRTLNLLYGYREFRNGQLECIENILKGKSTLLILPTGAGKSLCYTIPAYLMSRRNNSLTLVVCPTISLMEDQVANLPTPVSGACWNSASENVDIDSY